MEVKSLHKQYKHVLNLAEDMFELLVEKIELAFVLVFCPRHTSLPFLSQILVLLG